MEHKEQPKKSGSETRQRTYSLHVRLSPDELAEFEAKANNLELSLASFVRHMCLDQKPPRARRKPSVEVEAVARVLGELGKLGSNVNQIARVLNARGDVEPSAIDEAIDAIRDMRAACMEAMGRKA